MKKLSIGRPPAIKIEKESDLVYIRSNFEPHTVDGVLYYNYDEQVISLQNFLDSYLEQIRADIDYISMMSEVNL